MRNRKKKSGERRGASKAQAAIFDGITFLLMAGFSCALVYSAVTTYGDGMDNALYSFYEINYLQSAVKSLYYLNLEQLQHINAKNTNDPNGIEVEAYQTPPSLTPPSPIDPGQSCAVFAKYTGSIAVLDLVKKDLSDNPGKRSEKPALDDKFWSDPLKADAGVSAPGKQALRCALKELMKPFVLSGYDYYAEILNPQGGDPVGSNPYEAIPLGVESTLTTARITSNSTLAKMTDSDLINLESSKGSGCLYAQLPPISYSVLSVDVPLRVSLGTSCSEAQNQENLGGCQRNYILRVCVWQRP